MFRILTYRLKADRFGDLDQETLKILGRAAGQEGQPSRLPTALANLHCGCLSTHNLHEFMVETVDIELAAH